MMSTVPGENIDGVGWTYMYNIKIKSTYFLHCEQILNLLHNFSCSHVDL